MKSQQQQSALQEQSSSTAIQQISITLAKSLTICEMLLQANQAITGNMKSQQQQSVLQEQLANGKEQVIRLTAEKADALLQITELKQTFKETQVGPALRAKACCFECWLAALHAELLLFCMLSFCFLC